MSESDLAARSVAAVTGVVTDIEAAEDTASAGINTYVHIEPDDVIFGSLPEGPLVLREPGGRLRGRTEWVYGSPEYRVGEEVLVFLTQNADGSLRTTGMSMGKFSVERADGGTLNAVRHLGEGAALWDLQRNQLVSDPAPESYDFDGLVDTVRSAPAAAKSKLTVHAIKAVPAELSSATVREHQESFTYLSNPSRWFEPDTAQPIPYMVDPSGDVGVGAANSRAAINDAFAAWTNVPTSDLTLIDGGDLPQDITFAGCDGGNRLVFNDPFNEIVDPVGCSGVLAIGGFCASSETRIVNGTTFRRIRVGKITFNNGWSTCPGWNRCNLSEVATHELGHTLGFGHSNDVNATMYASAHFDGRCATLRADDLAAINFVYPSTGSPSPTPTKTPLPPTAAPTATSVATGTATASRTATATATRTVAIAPSATATSAILPTSTPTQSRHRVRGRIQYYNAARAVPNVTVSLSGETQDSTQTSSTGDYEFDSVSPGTWEVAAEKSSDFGTGISPLDAAYVLQSIVNLRTLDPSQLLACDATGDGHLSALDATRILQFSVGTLPRLPVADTCGSDWAFVPDPDSTQDLSVVNPRVAGGTCNDGKIMLDGMIDEALGQDFRAILFGDCTGNWSGVQSAARAAASAGSARVRLGRALLNGTQVSVPVIVRATGRYNALDLNVTYDATRLTPGTVVLGHGMSSGFTSQAANSGVLRIAMASAEPIRRRLGMLMSLEFTRADASTDPGTVAISAANVDEEPATIDASAASFREARRPRRGR